MPRVIRRSDTPNIFSVAAGKIRASEIAARSRQSGDYVIRRPINFSICTPKCILAIMQLVHEPAIARSRFSFWLGEKKNIDFVLVHWAWQALVGWVTAVWARWCEKSIKCSAFRGHRNKAHSDDFYHLSLVTHIAETRTESPANTLNSASSRS